MPKSCVAVSLNKRGVSCVLLCVFVIILCRVLSVNRCANGAVLRVVCAFGV